MRAARHAIVLVYRNTTIRHAAVEVRILGHVARRQLPLALVGQTVRVRAILASQPHAIRLCVVVAYIVHREIALPGGILAAIPALRNRRARGLHIFGVLRIGDGSAAHIHALACAHHGNEIEVRSVGRFPLQQAGIGETQHAAVDAVPIGGVHVLDDVLHLGHRLIPARLAGGLDLQLGQLLLLAIEHGIVVGDDHVAQRQVVFLGRIFLVR